MAQILVSETPESDAEDPSLSDNELDHVPDFYPLSGSRNHNKNQKNGSVSDMTMNASLETFVPT